MKIKKPVKIFLLLLFLSIVSAGIYLFSPYFHYSKTLILGETSLNKEKLMTMGKVDFDKNIYLIDLKEAEKNIKSDPMVKSIHIYRKFPLTLVFSLSDRIQAAAVSFNGGFAVIDDEGYVMKIMQNVQEVKLPIISGIKTKLVKLGEQIPVENEEQFSLILGLISGAQNARLIDIISDVNMSNPENVKMTTVNGITVLLGEGKNLNYKMLVLNQILLDLHSRNINQGVIDMRYDSYPVYKEG